MKNSLIFIISIFLLIPTTHAKQLIINVHHVDGDYLGTISMEDTPEGLFITPKLSGLTEGLHGFHVHENYSCDDQALAAGGHLSVGGNNKHLGPYGNGHLGDLPELYVNKDGKAVLSILAPRLSSKFIVKRSVIIHHGPDNYSDKPEPLGGGGGRIACGLIG